jgi:hypothetical protein
MPRHDRDLGGREISQATPPIPHDAAQGVRSDIETLKEAFTDE